MISILPSDAFRRIVPRVLVAFLAIVLFSSMASASTVIDLNALPLAPNSFWNGSDASGGFSSQGVSFNNYYYAPWDSWSGWAYSNINDTTTTGYTNQYAVFTGTGAGGSGNYAVAFTYGTITPSITIPDGMQIESVLVTNTTYPALSMLNGDGFSKKFGPTDWFLLTATGKDASNQTVGTVEFYLAKDGTVVNTWQSVDLSSLSAAKKLEFSLLSSDIGAYGMNTPAYFALDNVKVKPVPEPGSFVLLTFALGGLLLTGWKIRRKGSR